MLQTARIGPLAAAAAATPGETAHGPLHAEPELIVGLPDAHSKLRRARLRVAFKRATRTFSGRQNPPCALHRCQVAGQIVSTSRMNVQARLEATWHLLGPAGCRYSALQRHGFAMWTLSLSMLPVVLLLQHHIDC